MTSTHRMLATIFVWIAFAWSITLVYGLALTLWLSTWTLLGVTVFLGGVALLATRVIARAEAEG